MVVWGGVLISQHWAYIQPQLQKSHHINQMQNGPNEPPFKPIALRNKHTQAYERREMPQVLPVLRSLARQCPGFRRFPVLRILKDMARLFQLNLTEALFLLYLVRATQWGAGDACVRAYAGGVRDLLCFVHEEQEYRELLVYLLLASYSVKECLTRRQPALLHRASKICPNFPFAFRAWSARHAAAIQDLHPRLLNRLFIELCAQEREQAEEDQMATVDEVLEICTPYSEKRVEGNRVRIERLKREAEHDLWGSRPQKLRKMEKSCEGEICATFKEIVELHTEDCSDELTETRFNELGIELGIELADEPRGKGRLGERMADSEEDFCESFNLSQPESQDHILFMKSKTEYERCSLRFFCDDSQPHLI